MILLIQGSRSQGEKKADSNKIKFAGNKQRLDDDQSDCAEDISRLCPEIPRGNNFAFLSCLQEKAKVYFVSEVMVDTDYFFDVSFKTFRLVLEPSSVEI